LKVLIPDSLPLALTTPHAEIEYIPYSVTSTDFATVQDAELMVVWMNSSENLSAAKQQLTHLRLVQTLAAGPDQVLAAGFPDSVSIASGRGLHDTTVAEHTLALALATIRNLDNLNTAQREHRWDSKTINEQADPSTSHLYTLKGAQVLIIGFGSIAHHLAPMFSQLGAIVTGVAQSAGTRDGYPVIASSEMSAKLSEFNVVISLLPYAPENEKKFNTDFFAAMNSSAIFINVGRGKTVDEDALAHALLSKQIRKAAIDVTYLEPLDSSSPLWEIPELIITPHISGGRPQNAEQLIEANAQLLLSGGHLLNLVTQ
jgi:phosphoglycerate dehydrogenase-like enzyme